MAENNIFGTSSTFGKPENFNQGLAPVEKTVAVPTNTDAPNIELGDWISITSTENPEGITGDVIYRDKERIRIKYKQSRTHGREYLLDEYGDFKEEYGIFSILNHRSSEFYHFSAMIGVQPGETVEFYTLDGEPAVINAETKETSGIVSQIIATETEDALILQSGVRLDFNGVGPNPASEVAIIVPAIPKDEGGEVASDAQLSQQQLEERESAFQFQSIDQLLREIMPTSVIEEVPTAERFYPDAIQRQDMYNDFVLDLTAEKQKNIKALREVSQLTEYLLALKQSTVKLNVAGRPIGVQKSTFDSLADVTNEVASSYIPACVPIYDVKKTLYFDSKQQSPHQNLIFKSILHVEHEAHKRTTDYEGGLMPANGLAFYSYLDSIFQSDLHPYTAADREGAQRETVAYEQEGYVAPEPGSTRFALPQTGVKGYLSSFDHKRGFAFTPLDKEYINSLTVQTARFLPSVRAVVNKGISAGTVSQPADQVVTTGYVILDTPTILHARTLVNIPSLMTRIQIGDYQRERKVQHLETIDSMAVADANAETHALYFTKEEVARATPEFWQVWVRNNLYRTLSPVHGFSPASPLLAVLLDAFVPNRGDYPKALQDEVWRFIDSNIGQWIQASGASRQRIQKKLADGGALGEAYLPIIENPNTLNERVLNDTFLNILVRRINEKETILKNNPQVLLNEFEKGFGTEAFIQYVTILTKLDNRETAFDYDFLRQKLEDIIKSEQNRNNLLALQVKSNASKPEVNSCAHVRALVGVRRALSRSHDTATYIEMFKAFLAKFQGPREGNWMKCEVCKKELVCVHEIMTLNEALHPGRSQSLHRKLLLDFGGPVFEAHYTCKNCGIPIDEIEYDTHLEYNDEGQAISGRSVIKEDVKRESLEEIVSRKEVIQFKTEDEQKIYLIIKVISERMGANDISKEMVDRIVYYAQFYLDKKVPTQSVYETQTRAAQTRGTRGRIPSYQEYSRNQRIGVVAALLLIELQTSNPPIQIKYPFSQCRFSIQGFPTEGMNPEEAGTGALDYVACCVASIQRTEDPWTYVTWASYPEIDRRTQTIKHIIVTTMNLLLGTTRSGTQLSISSDIRLTMRKRIESLKLEQRKELASSKDKLPAGFMPEPFVQFPDKVVNEPFAGDPTSAVANMNIAGTDGPKKNIQYRLAVLYSQLKLDAHKKAEKDGVLIYGSDRSDSFATPISLMEVKRGALQVLGLVPLEEEARRLAMALRTIDLRTPTMTPAGTHIWTPWAPRVEPVLKVEIPKNILYKLFLRNCYKGPTIGAPHKLGFGNACKNCGFQFPVSMDIIDPEKEGKPALDAQGVDYSETEFEKILAARREKRSQALFVRPEEPELLKNIQMWIEAPAMGDDDAGMWQEVTTILRGLYNAKTVGNPMARAVAWGDFVKRTDTAKEALKQKVAGSATRKTRADAVAAGFINNLEILTQHPLTSGFDSMMNTFVSPLMQKAQAHQIATITSLRPVKERGKADVIFARGIKQWMKISGEHTTLLNQIMAHHSELIGGGSIQMREVCKRVGRELGRWLQMWKRQIFEEPLLGFTETEAQYVLLFVIIRLLLEITDPTTWLYKDLPTEAAQQKPDAETVMKEVVVFIAENMQKTVSNTKLPSQKELEEILLKRAEIERNYVIDIFDKLDEDEKPLEKLQKKLGLGKWAIGRNVRDYSVELFEHDRNQRIAMGLRDAPQLAEGRQTRADFGFASLGGGESRADRAYDHGDADMQENGE